MPQTPAKSKTGWVIVFGTALLVAVVVAIVGWRRGWLSGEPKYDTPALSAAYLPADTGAVVHVNLRELQDSKGVNKEVGPALQNLLDQLAPHDLRDALGVDPAHDIDWMQLTLHPGPADYPLEMMLLLAGKFEPAKFKLTPKGLRQISKPGDRYRLYELPDERLLHPLTLTTGDHMVLLSDRPARVTAALTDAAEGKPPVLEDAALAEQVQKIDRQQTIWGVASLKKLKQGRSLPPFPSQVLDFYLQPIMEKTDLVYGGITCGNDIDGTVHFQTDSDDKAKALEKYLKDQCESASAAYRLAKLLRSNNEYLPLLQFLGTGKVTRDGQLVTLHCHLP
jgi:hypothetical protein